MSASLRCFPGCVITRAAILVAFVALTASACHADNFKCAPPKVGYPGVDDQDTGADSSPDACLFLNPIMVPMVPGDFDKPSGNNRAQGWGFLVLQFDRTIDGGAFLFGPNCLDDTQTQGTLNENGEDVTPTGAHADPNTMIKLGPGNYGIGATGTPSVPADPNSDKFLTFNVTIMYDSGNGQPRLVSAYWKSKAPDGGQDFVYRPDNYAPAGRTWYDITAQASIPEPGSIGLFGAGAGLLLAGRKRRNVAGAEQERSSRKAV